MTVVTASGEWRLHSLLLASRSEFFYRQARKRQPTRKQPHHKQQPLRQLHPHSLHSHKISIHPNVPVSPAALTRLTTCDDTLSPCLHVLHSPAPNVSAHVNASRRLLTLSLLHPSCRALAGQFAESRSKRIELHLEKAPGEEVRRGTQH